MQSDPDHFPKFARAADKLRAEGHDVYNPSAANLDGLPLATIMKIVLAQLCECDTIAMIPGWWRSWRIGGAHIEWLLAKYLGHKVIYL